MDNDFYTLVDCECEAKVYLGEKQVDIEYCPTHASAPDLLEALEVGLSWMESLEKWIEFLPWINKSKFKRDKIRVNQAIAKAEGEE